MFADVDHESELENQMIHEKHIVKLLEDSVLSETMCVDEDHENGCGVPSSTPAKNIVPASDSPQSESQRSASVSAYEDALAELSSTKTPVLPTRSRATPLRRSARKAAHTSGD